MLGMECMMHEGHRMMQYLTVHGTGQSELSCPRDNLGLARPITTAPGTLLAPFSVLAARQGNVLTHTHICAEPSAQLQRV